MAVDHLDSTFAALADPTRRAILKRLAQGEASVNELAAPFPMSVQAVSKHLHALSDAGLVHARREGRETRYTLTPAPLADAMRWMTEVGAEWDDRLARLARRSEL